MNKLTSLFIIGGSILAGGFISTPARATLQGTLQHGQAQYVEVNLEPGQYLFYIIAKNTITKDISEASFSIYETNGKFIRKSALLPPELQIPHTKLGTAIEISRPQAVHFEIRMDSCKAPLCGFGVIPMKVSSNGLEMVTLRSRVLPNRPPYAASSPEISNNSGVQPPQSPPTTADLEQQNGGKQYVFKTNSHINTGISVNPGDTIRVQATGTIGFGMFTPSGGPNGIIFNPVYNYFADVPHGRLMARFRQPGMQPLDGWSPIGEGWDQVREVKLSSPGILEFLVNDNKPGDNRGNFRIEVTIHSGKQ